MVSDEKKLRGLPPFEDAPFLHELSPEERELVQQALEQHPGIPLKEAIDIMRMRKVKG